MSKTSNREQGSRPIAFCAMMAALSAAVMLTGGLIPVFTYCSPLLASMMLIPVLVEYGTQKGWMVWAVSSVLTLMIGIDKEAAFFYMFLGWYPILKPVFDRIRKRPARVTVKALVFTCSIGVMYLLICFVFRIGEIVESFSPLLWVNLLFVAVLVIVMLLYDRTLIGIYAIYCGRIRSKLKH